MSFILKVKEYYYLAERIKVGEEWRNKLLRRATEAEIQAYRATRQETDMATMTCNNPDCDRQIQIPRSQKRKFLVTYPLRYGRFVRVYCSEKCQQEHSVMLRKLN